MPDDLPVASHQNSADSLAVTRGLAGFTVGAAVGALLFHLARQSGLYAIVVPGAVAGIFCGGFMGKRIAWMGFLCGILGFVVTLAVEWKLHPFVANKSLEFFLANFWQLPPFRLFLFALGGFLAGWFGMGRDGTAWFDAANRRRDRTVRDAEG